MMNLTPLAVSFTAAVMLSAVSREQLPSKDDIKFIDDIWNTTPVKVAGTDRSGMKSTVSRPDRSKDVRPARTGNLPG